MQKISQKQKASLHGMATQRDQPVDFCPLHEALFFRAVLCIIDIRHNLPATLALNTINVRQTEFSEYATYTPGEIT